MCSNLDCILCIGSYSNQHIPAEYPNLPDFPFLTWKRRRLLKSPPSLFLTAPTVAAKGVDIAGNILPYTVHITHNLKTGSSHPHDVVLLDVGQAVPQEGPGAT